MHHIWWNNIVKVLGWHLDLDSLNTIAANEANSSFL